MALGQADYTRTPAMLPAALDCLLSNVSVATKVSQHAEDSVAKLTPYRPLNRMSKHAAHRTSLSSP